MGSAESLGSSGSQTQRSRRTGLPGHTTCRTAVRALDPERPCAKSQPSLEPQPDLSFRPLASALRKPFPGPAGELPPRKVCMLPTTCLPAPRCSPPCRSRVGQSRPSQSSRWVRAAVVNRQGTGEDTDGLGFQGEKHWVGPRTQEWGLETGWGSSGFRKEAKG